MDNNPNIANPIWNPLMGVKLAEVEIDGQGTVHAVVFEYKGETGEQATIIYEAAEFNNFIAELTALANQGKRLLDSALAHGFDGSIAIHGDGPELDIPNDLSSLED